MKRTQAHLPPTEANSHRVERANSRRTWPWALGSILAVALVLVATVAGRHIVSSARHVAALVPAPPLPALSVIALTPPSLRVQRIALDASDGHVAALTSAQAPQCPPVGACPAAPPLTTFVLLDSATGTVVAQAPLTGAAALASQSAALVTDTERHIAYAISPQTIVAFSSQTATPLTHLGIASATHGDPITGVALDTADHTLLLVAGSRLLSLDPQTGSLLAAQAVPGASLREDGPVFDPQRSRVYLLSSQSTLTAYDARTLTQVGQFQVSPGSRLGPFNAAARVLYTFSTGGVTSAVQVDTVFATPHAQLKTLPTVAALQNADALGWNGAQRELYVATPTALTAQNLDTGRPLAALPLRIAWNSTEPLLTDTTRGLLYLPTPQGALAIVRVTHAPTSAALTSGTATILARSALTTFLPDTNQDPPFVTPETFPLGAGDSPTNYWIHFSDLGWRGPYAGSATTAVQPESGRPGAYLVTFTITWYQLFQRSHTWVCEVAHDGSVRLQSDTGDAVP